MSSVSIGNIVATHAKPSDKIAAVPTSRSWFSRLLAMMRWYRHAVTAPETEKEKAEWQQSSF